jgi:hypothetical protein
VSWAYVADHPQKPHLHPVATPGGVVLTELEPADHPWQRGIWFAVKHVDGDNFWEEGDPAGWGTQRHEDADTLAWVRPDGVTVALRERRRLTHVDLGPSAYGIDWDTTLEVPAEVAAPVVLDRTPFNGLWGGYSGLAFRGRADWTDTRLLVDDGTTHDRIAPHRSRWCDLSSDAAGICVLDHPANPSHPVPFYVTCRAGLGYGDGWANTLYPAFLWDGPMELRPGGPLRFRYRLVVHDGSWDRAAADAAWEAFARS